MTRATHRIVLNARGSARTVAILITVTLLIIAAGIRLIRTNRSSSDALPQAAEQIDSHAFYIAQTALDRSIKALVADPKWRDGFAEVPFEQGKYNVHVYDTERTNPDRESLPPNYVRIVASSEVEGVIKEVEAVWVNAMSAFNHTYAAGERIELGNHGAREIVFMGDLHNNAWEGGKIEIHDGVRLYGNVSSSGPVVIGSEDPSRPTRVYGSVWGSDIDISRSAEIRKFESLSEWTEGVDLNGDGDTTDIGVERGPIDVVGAHSIRSADRPVGDGETDSRIGGGSVQVTVGRDGLGPVVDPRPDFTAYYELVTGLSSYPPSADHRSTHILGDGDGHYFASGSEFLDWLRFQNERDVFCWRCAGDERIDPGNTTPCPTCGGTGRVRAVVVSGIFYVDDAVLDLTALGKNIILHGTIVVAEGNPYEWPSKKIPVPGGEAEIAHFPQKGRLELHGQNRMHFTQTYRSDQDAADYTWQQRKLHAGEAMQIVPVPVPRSGHFMRDFPAIIAADAIIIEPRGEGFAYHPGDIGDERITVLQGVVYAENEVRLHGRGGWSGEKMIFDEMEARDEDEALDEPVLNVDLNGDHDVFDRVEISAISMVPVVPVANGKYSVDINNDGVLGEVTIGMDYIGFFNDNGYPYPTLIYLQGLVLGRYIHSCEETLVQHDPGIPAAGIPFGFEVSFGSTTYQGLVSWSERHP